MRHKTSGTKSKAIGKRLRNQLEKERFRILKEKKKTYMDNLQRSIHSNFQRKMEKKKKVGEEK